MMSSHSFASHLFGRSSIFINSVKTILRIAGTLYDIMIGIELKKNKYNYYAREHCVCLLERWHYVKHTKQNNIC